MDHQGNLLKPFLKVTDPAGKTVVKFAVGTGRLTGLYASLAKEVYAYDLALEMVKLAGQKLRTIIDAPVGMSSNISQRCLLR